MLRSFIIFRIIQFVLAVCLISGIKVQAQGGHYWTEQYGTRSILMGGSVIGGVEDLGAVFYNPGHLAQIENPAFLLSAKLYQLENLTFLNALIGTHPIPQKYYAIHSILGTWNSQEFSSLIKPILTSEKLRLLYD